MPIRMEDRENYSEMLISLSRTLSRQLASVVGVGKHHLYFRPLWDPKEWVSIWDKDEGSQFVGFEYFGINRHISHLVDISTVTFCIELEVRGKTDESFLDFTNPNGESLVLSSADAKAFSLLLNDARVSYDDLSFLYRDSVPRVFVAFLRSGWHIASGNHGVLNRLAQS